MLCKTIRNFDQWSPIRQVLLLCPPSEVPRRANDRNRRGAERASTRWRGLAGDASRPSAPAGHWQLEGREHWHADAHQLATGFYATSLLGLRRLVLEERGGVTLQNEAASRGGVKSGSALNKRESAPSFEHRQLDHRPQPSSTQAVRATTRSDVSSAVLQCRSIQTSPDARPRAMPRCSRHAGSEMSTSVRMTGSSRARALVTSA